MGYAPENTFASFERAIELGVDAIELDVHLTADGEAVVIHDAELHGTTDGEGLVGQKTLAELKRLDAGVRFAPEFAGQRIPTLGEVLAWARGKCVLDVEIKGGPWPYDGIEARVVDLIRRHEMVDQTIVISFTHTVVARVKALAPEIATGTLWSCRPIDPVAVAQAAGADAIMPTVAVLRRRDRRAGARGGAVRQPVDGERAGGRRSPDRARRGLDLQQLPGRRRQGTSSSAALIR